MLNNLIIDLSRLNPLAECIIIAWTAIGLTELIKKLYFKYKQKTLSKWIKFVCCGVICFILHLIVLTAEESITYLQTHTYIQLINLLALVSFELLIARLYYNNTLDAKGYYKEDKNG